MVAAIRNMIRGAAVPLFGHAVAMCSYSAIKITMLAAKVTTTIKNGGVCVGFTWSSFAARYREISARRFRSEISRTQELFDNNIGHCFSQCSKPMDEVLGLRYSCRQWLAEVVGYKERSTPFTCASICEEVCVPIAKEHVREPLFIGHFPSPPVLLLRFWHVPYFDTVTRAFLARIPMAAMKREVIAWGMGMITIMLTPGMPIAEVDAALLYGVYRTATMISQMVLPRLLRAN